MDIRLQNRTAVTAEYIRRHRKGDPGWLMMEIAAGLDCNLNCVHCSVGVMQQCCTPFSFALDDLKHLITQAKENGFLSICFVGGEPLVYPHLDEAVSYVAQLGMLPQIITNGLLLDRARLKELVNRGIDTICFSVNSADPAEHDEIVNCKGAFSETMQMLEEARKEQVDVAVSVVPFQESISSGQFMRLIAMLQKKHIKLGINYPAVVGNNQNVGSLLPPESLELVREYHAKCKSWSDFMLTGKYACPACKHAIYAVPSGEIMVCAFLHVSFGNIFSTNLANILNDMKENKVFQPEFEHCLAGEDPVFLEKHILGKIEPGQYYISSEKLELDC